MQSVLVAEQVCTTSDRRKPRHARASRSGRDLGNLNRYPGRSLPQGNDPGGRVLARSQARLGVDRVRDAVPLLFDLAHARLLGEPAIHVSAYALHPPDRNLVVRTHPARMSGSSSCVARHE